jgi:hypothetical protein
VAVECPLTAAADRHCGSAGRGDAARSGCGTVRVRLCHVAISAGPVPAQMWQGMGPVPVHMWTRGGPVPVQMWPGVSPVPAQMWQR